MRTVWFWQADTGNWHFAEAIPGPGGNLEPGIGMSSAGKVRDKVRASNPREEIHCRQWHRPGTVPWENIGDGTTTTNGRKAVLPGGVILMAKRAAKGAKWFDAFIDGEKVGGGLNLREAQVAAMTAWKRRSAAA